MVIEGIGNPDGLRPELLSKDAFAGPTHGSLGPDGWVLQGIDKSVATLEPWEPGSPHDIDLAGAEAPPGPPIIGWAYGDPTEDMGKLPPIRVMARVFFDMVLATASFRAPGPMRIKYPGPKGLFRTAGRVAFQLNRQSSGVLLNAALLPHNSGPLTNVGRALTKHPEVLGSTKAVLRQTLRTDRAINEAAEGVLSGILQSGTVTVRALPRYGSVIEVRGSSGFGARWYENTGEFIGFVNP